jgi:hypothetical protein
MKNPRQPRDSGKPERDKERAPTWLEKTAQLNRGAKIPNPGHSDSERKTPSQPDQN